MQTRADLEQQEELLLAPYAQFSSKTRGRKYPEQEHPYRTAYQRDRDRIIHSGAFRRLQYKTQVFVNHEGDYYRTRITHTLEVAQIARSVARVLRLNQDLTEAVALAHDLGHTPFGHCGERVLNELLQESGGFEHNAQSYRIVTRLEHRYPDFPGLNLTHEVLEGIDKHHTRYDGETRETRNQGSLEAQIVDLADEIAYCGHDLDDGLTSGLLHFDELEEVTILRELFAKSSEKWAALDEEHRKYQVVRTLLNAWITDLVEETKRRLEHFAVKSADAIREAPEPIAAFSKEMRLKLTQLKRFLYERMYRHPKVVRMEVKAERVVRELFRIYSAMPEVLPRGTQKRLKETSEPKERILGDYIAGMTDRFAIEEYTRLTDPTQRV